MVSGFEVMKLGEIVSLTENDIDDQMNLAVTKKELGITLFALHFVHVLFPELAEDVEALCQKVKEVADAQDFLEFNE